MLLGYSLIHKKFLSKRTRTKEITHLASISFALSPIVMILTLDLSDSSAIYALILLDTEEWTPPQSPRSDVRAIMRVPGLSSFNSNFSLKSPAPSPKGRAALRSLSALAYLAADTIFIDCVIFW